MAINPVLLAQGIRPVAQDLVFGGEKLRTSRNQNALLDIGIANAPNVEARAQAQSDRLGSAEDRKQAEFDDDLLFTAAKEFRFRFDSADRPGMIAALNGLPTEGRLGEIRDEGLQALGDNNPDNDRDVLGVVDSIIQARTESQKSTTPAAVQTFDTLVGKINDPDVSNAEKQAARINLGIDPRAKGPQVVDVGGVPHLWNPQTETLSQFSSDGKLITPDKVASNKAQIASTVKGAEQAVVQSGKIFEQLGPVNKSIVNINDAINAIDQGADTGAVMSKLPSITEASVTLDNVRGQMGLDIIGATTFGALSEGELQFALDTAIPTNLDEGPLREWLVRKGDAQKKYAEELRKAAIFLGKPGNTVSSYLDSLEANGLFSRGDNAPAGDDQPEGTIIRLPNDQRQRLVNGEWVNIDG